MSAARLPSALEATALIRMAEATGGFGMVLRKGEPDSGSILIVILDNQGFGQTHAQAFERLPTASGSRSWSLSRAQEPERKEEFDAYLARRIEQDPDLWVLELTIADGEQFILNLKGYENKAGFMG